MSFTDQFRQKMNRMGGNRKDRNFLRAQREFQSYFDNTLTSTTCLIDGVLTKAVLQDQSQSNNKDLSDDKYLIVPNSVNVGVGSYVEWRGAEWLVFTEEYKTIPTHQQLKIKHVNRRLKWITDRETKTVCNNGDGWGAYVQNQTLYTLGVSFSGEHLPLANAKMSVYIKNTPETRAVKVGTRLFIAGQVYKIEFADLVSRTGLISWLLDEDTKNPETDNFDLGIADYYLGNGDAKPKDDEKKESTDEDKADWSIEGETRIRQGRSYVYKLVTSDPEMKVNEWILGDIEGLPFFVTEKGERSISIRVKDDFRVVGQQSTIAAKVNGEIKNIALKVIKKFG